MGSFLTAAVRFVVAVDTFGTGAFRDVDAFFAPAFVTIVVPALAVLISLSPFSLAMAAESAVPGRLGCLLGGREDGGSEENVLWNVDFAGLAGRELNEDILPDTAVFSGEAGRARELWDFGDKTAEFTSLREAP